MRGIKGSEGVCGTTSFGFRGKRKVREEGMWIANLSNLREKGNHPDGLFSFENHLRIKGKSLAPVHDCCNGA